VVDRAHRRGDSVEWVEDGVPRDQRGGLGARADVSVLDAAGDLIEGPAVTLVVP
jgi:hypothetical protein